jgi:hypothetical protein
MSGVKGRPAAEPGAAARHREAVGRITRFRGVIGLALGRPCDEHGVLAGEPCWEPSDEGPPVCASRTRESQRQREGNG